MQIKCPYCEHACCLQCAKRYLLDTKQDAHCMSCSKSWTRKNLVDLFPVSFIYKTYKNYREQVLYERELGLMPSTQSYVEVQIQREKDNEEIMRLRENIRRLQYKITLLREKRHTVENKVFIQKCANTHCNGFVSNKWKCGICEKYTCSECLEIKEDEHKCTEDNVKTAMLIKKDTKACPKCATMIFKIRL
jgi:hypothetical protein